MKQFSVFALSVFVATVANSAEAQPAPHDWKYKCAVNVSQDWIVANHNLTTADLKSPLILSYNHDSIKVSENDFGFFDTEEKTFFMDGKTIHTKPNDSFESSDLKAGFDITVNMDSAAEGNLRLRGLFSVIPFLSRWNDPIAVAFDGETAKPGHVFHASMRLYMPQQFSMGSDPKRSRLIQNAPIQVAIACSPYTAPQNPPPQQ